MTNRNQSSVLKTPGTLLTSLFIAAVVLSGCNRMHSTASMSQSNIIHDTNRPTITARFVNSPVRLDCCTNDAAWKKQHVYSLCLGDDKAAAGEILKEQGNVRLAWDAANLYVLAEFEDSDIIALGDKNDMPHYRMGDTCEIFIKPADQPWFWEIWITPKNKRTAVLWSERDHVASAFGQALEDLSQQGLVVPEKLTNCRLNFTSAIQLHDKGWICEAAIPFANIDTPRTSGKTQQWLILAARQNYFERVDKAHRELSMTPKLTKSSFDRHEEYAILKLLKD
jgi:hypothetical protein